MHALRFSAAVSCLHTRVRDRPRSATPISENLPVFLVAAFRLDWKPLSVPYALPSPAHKRKRQHQTPCNITSPHHRSLSLLSFTPPLLPLLAFGSVPWLTPSVPRLASLFIRFRASPTQKSIAATFGNLPTSNTLILPGRIQASCQHRTLPDHICTPCLNSSHPCSALPTARPPPRRALRTAPKNPSTSPSHIFPARVVLSSAQR